MKNSQNMREVSSLFMQVLEVSVARHEAEFGSYQRLKLSNPKLGFEALGCYIELLEELYKRLVFLRDDIITRVEKDAEDTVAAALEMKKIHHEQSTLTEKEKKKLTDSVLRNIPRSGETEELVVDSVRRIFSLILVRLEALIARSKKLKESYSPVV